MKPPPLSLLALSVLVLASCKPDAVTDMTPEEADVPALSPVAASGSFVTITAGIDNSCVIDTGGQAYCMGYGGQGAVGYGGFLRIIEPYAVAGNHTFSQVSGGGLHMCGVTSAGQPFCWGDNGLGQLGAATSTCGFTGPCSPVPVAVSGGLTLREIDAGNQFTCGLDLNGGAYCWGDNTYGQLGNGTTQNRATPTPVAGGHSFVALGAGGFHACAVTAGGQLYCWGLNSSGQLGAPAPSTCTYFQPYPCAMAPIPAGGALRFSDVDAGSVHSCALETMGKAYCWGRNSFGQVGVPQNGNELVPVAVNSSQRFTRIATGYRESCAIDAAGQGFCWGASNGPNVTLIPGYTWTVLSPNSDHRCGVTTAGGAFCWGHEDYGELGDGGTHQDTRTAPTPLAPVHVTDQPPVARIIITGCTSLACTFNGSNSTDDFGIISYIWSFGDGATGTGLIASHTYLASGTYTVTLTVTDSSGQTGTATTSVTTNQPPVAAFRYTCSVTTLKCKFDGSRSTDDYGIVKYAWHSSLPTKPDKTGITITRNFTRGQQWTETLTVTDGQGLTSVIAKVIVTP